MRSGNSIYILFAALVLIALGGGCAAGPASRVEELGPTKLVQTYYESLAAGDTGTAGACLSPSLLRLWVSAPDSDFRNLISLSNIVVSAPASIRSGTNTGNGEEVQVTAQYDAVYRKEITWLNGRQFRFIYVARSTKTSPWKIVSIGTGP